MVGEGRAHAGKGRTEGGSRGTVGKGRGACLGDGQLTAVEQGRTEDDMASWNGVWDDTTDAAGKAAVSGRVEIKRAEELEARGTEAKTEEARGAIEARVASKDAVRCIMIERVWFVEFRPRVWGYALMGTFT